MNVVSDDERAGSRPGTASAPARSASPLPAPPETPASGSGTVIRPDSIAQVSESELQDLAAQRRREAEAAASNKGRMKNKINEELGILSKAVEGLDAGTAVKGMCEHLAKEIQLNYSQYQKMGQMERQMQELDEERERLEESLESKTRLLKSRKKERSTAVAMKPTKFVSGVDNIRTYIARFKVYAKASHADDWAVVELLTSYLDQTAQRRVLRLGLDAMDPKPTVEKALEMIIKELEEVQPKSKKRAKLFDAKQREDERISDFATRLAEDAAVAYPEDEVMRRSVMLDVFVIGVREDAVAQDLLKTKPADFETAVKEAIELEAIYQERNERQKGDKSHILYSIPEELREAVEGAPSSPRQTGTTDKKCYSCGEIGHLKANCPKDPKRCFQCGKVGHIRRECRVGKTAKSIQCRICKKIGHTTKNCAEVICFRCNGKGHVSTNCTTAPKGAVEAAIKGSRQRGNFRMKPTAGPSN